jgi:hypothetical protein
VIKQEPGVEYRHDPGCPTAASSDAMMEDDRQWFEEHPYFQVRHRPPTKYDMVELNWETGSPVNTRWAGVVAVHQAAPGYRFRDLSRCYPVSAGVA